MKRKWFYWKISVYIEYVTFVLLLYIIQVLIDFLISNGTLIMKKGPNKFHNKLYVQQQKINKYNDDDKS